MKLKKKEQKDFPIGTEVEYWANGGVLYGVVESHPKGKLDKYFVNIKLNMSDEIINVSCDYLTTNADDNESPEFPVGSLVIIKSLNKVAVVIHPSEKIGFCVVKIENEKAKKIVGIQDLELMKVAENYTNVFNEYVAETSTKETDVMDIRKMSFEDIKSYCDILEFTTIDLSYLSNKEIKYLIQDYKTNRESNKIEAFFHFVKGKDPSPEIDIDETIRLFNESYVGTFKNRLKLIEFVINSEVNIPNWIVVDYEKTSKNLDSDYYVLFGHYFKAK